MNASASMPPNANSNANLTAQPTVNPTIKSKLSSDLYWLRGVCIGLVVMGHVIGFSRSQGMRQVYQSDLAGWGWFHDFIITFHIPVFLIISGIAFTAFSNRQVSYRQFLRSKFITLVVPLVCWSPAYFFFQSLVKGRSISFADVVRSMIFPYEIFWFLHALIFATVFAFIWFKLFKSPLGYFGVSVFLFILCFQAKFFYTYWHWNLFYAVGVVIAPYLPQLQSRLERLSLIKMGLLISLSLIGMILAKQFLPLGGILDSARLVNGSLGFLMMYALVSLQDSPVRFSLPRLRRSIGDRFLQWGKHSMMIYLFHGYFTRSTIILITRFGLPNPAIYFVLTTAAGVLGPVVLYTILRPRSKAFVYSVGGAR